MIIPLPLLILHALLVMAHIRRPFLINQLWLLILFLAFAMIVPLIQVGIHILDVLSRIHLS